MVKNLFYVFLFMFYFNVKLKRKYVKHFVYFKKTFLVISSDPVFEI